MVQINPSRMSEETLSHYAKPGSSAGGFPFTKRKMILSMFFVFHIKAVLLTTKRSGS
jgi:hypothetical protein